MSETLHFGPYAVDFTHRDKVLFPDAGLTKGDLLGWYRDAAESILPHLRDRPVSLQRFPDGIGADGFYQKEVGRIAPDWVDTVAVEKEGGTVTEAVVSNEATLAWLVQLGTITPHAWLSTTADLHRPDRVVFDLDPPGDDFEPVRFAARALKALLDERGLPTFAMTTGGRGLHVVVPLRPEAGFDDVREAARGLAEALASRHPDRLTTEVRKAKRDGRLFLDVLRNAYAQTAVTPWAVRARPGAPVAVPIGWEELDDPALCGARWTLADARERLDVDPWAGWRRRAVGPDRLP